MKNPLEYVIGDLESKKQWREVKARVKALPAPYRTAYKGLERYAMIFGPVDHPDTLIRMVGDLVELLESAAADQQPVRDVVGEDPTDFVETFIDAYRGHGRSFVERERARLAADVAAAVREQEPDGGGAR